ncbi:hypothetical protein [Mesorhizobium sp. CA12]|uniref:hypothetical protein n=1 Tax=Mesorhizobium sp. CA12 TaxID=2876644 RepID=UPI001CCA1AE0|nr:hypothetical protein [Mesorhizobium sp. CA12]
MFHQIGQLRAFYPKAKPRTIVSTWFSGKHRRNAKCRGFRCSLDVDIRLAANIENQNDTGFDSLLVSCDSEIRAAPDIKVMRISESGHQQAPFERPR